MRSGFEIFHNADDKLLKFFCKKITHKGLSTTTDKTSYTLSYTGSCTVLEGETVA